MELGEKDIREFADIWREEFKEEISPERSRERASLLLELYALLAGLPGAGASQATDPATGPTRP